MLRIIQNTSPAGAKTYFSTADYYSEGREVMGVWRGKAAERLGLTGEIQQKDWDALCDNTDPRTGGTLTVRQNGVRRVGYDFNFHAPKGLSLLYAMTQDERLLDAFTASVNDTMTDMEAEMKARVRVDGQNSDRVTGNMAWGEYVHFTSRPVAGVPDPHLHAHCFVFNATFDAAEPSTRRGTGADAAAAGPATAAGEGGRGLVVHGEGGRWKAGQFGDLKRDAPYFEALFHSRLARRLEDLGLATQRTRTGWELSGIDPYTLKAFSRRTTQIEQEAKDKGITDLAQKSDLGAKTREKKVKGLTFANLQAEWNKRLSDTERAALAAVKERIGNEPIAEAPDAARDAVTFAIDHGFTRNSTLPERTLAAAALKHGVGKASADAVLKDLGARDLIKVERGGRTIVTTREVLAEETRTLDFARRGRGAFERLGRDSADNYTFTRDYLSTDQKHAVLHVLRSRDRVTIVRGAAGVGKTTMMKEAVEAIEQQGTQVYVFAPSTQAARGVLREEEHFERADTVARLLVDTTLQSELKGQVIWIDEAGLLSSKDMAAVFDLAQRENARVILSGDQRQHASVERGSPLRLLETEAGLVPAEITQIPGQSHYPDPRTLRR